MVTDATAGQTTAAFPASTARPTTITASTPRPTTMAITTAGPTPVPTTSSASLDCTGLRNGQIFMDRKI